VFVRNSAVTFLTLIREAGCQALYGNPPATYHETVGVQI
jgi:hypothetical protein